MRLYGSREFSRKTYPKRIRDHDAISSNKFTRTVSNNETWLSPRTKDLPIKGDCSIGGTDVRLRETVRSQNSLKGDDDKKAKFIDGENAGVQNNVDATPQSIDLLPSKRLFLRNLSYISSEDDIKDMFSSYGTLDEVSIITMQTI